MDMRILVIDDDPTQLILCSEELAASGYEVTVAADGALGKSRIEAEAFDLVVCDFEMPVLNGLGLLAWLRACPDESISSLPVIMLTGRDDDEAIRAAFESGATSYVQKPVNPLNFCHHVRFVLRSSRNEAGLRAARDAATKAVASRDGLMMNLRHELRSPLHILNGFAEVLENDPGALPEDARDAVGYMREAAMGINDRLSKVFSYHDVLNRSGDLRIAELELHDLLTEVSLPLMRSIAEKRIELCNHVSRDALILGDRQALGTALSQIIENAVKHCPEGGTVSLDFSPGADGTGLLSVADDGPGFDLSTAETLLEPFAQGDAGLTRVSTGLGIGLSVANFIVLEHGGSIDLTNRPDQAGAMVTLTLPAQVSERRARVA